MLIVHYHKQTGRIGAWGSGDSETSHLPDHDIARIENALTIDARVHRIDVETCQIVEKTTAEIAIEGAPSLVEITAIIRGALAASDEYMMSDRTVTNRDAWVTYRQALRDLSNLPDVAAMIDSWPIRPDGIDAVPGLRARLADLRNVDNEHTEM